MTERHVSKDWGGDMTSKERAVEYTNENVYD